MRFGIYEVNAEYDDAGNYKGYRVGVVQSEGKQGKLYIPKDGREHYQAKKIDDLVIPDPQIPEYDKEYLDTTDGKRKILKGKKRKPKDEELEI